jgi:hypothetical protein
LWLLPWCEGGYLGYMSTSIRINHLMKSSASTRLCLKEELESARGILPVGIDESDQGMNRCMLSAADRSLFYSLCLSHAACTEAALSMVITFTHATTFTSGNRIRHVVHDGQNQGLSYTVALVMLAETGILITVITGFKYHPMSRSIMAV